jgi:hypothetical protein
MIPPIPSEHVTLASQYLKRYEEEKRIRVYYIESVENGTGEPCFFYAIASGLLHERMVRCLMDGTIPDFAVIVERGYGKPTAEIKAKIREYYGFADDIDETEPMTAVH